MSLADTPQAKKLRANAARLVLDHAPSSRDGARVSKRSWNPIGLGEPKDFLGKARERCLLHWAEESITPNILGISLAGPPRWPWARA